jgi:hypothetical protein
MGLKIGKRIKGLISKTQSGCPRRRAAVDKWKQLLKVIENARKDQDFKNDRQALLQAQLKG